MSMDPIRVIIADDHPVLRNGIRGVLDLAMDIEVIGEATTGAEAVEMVKSIVPDVLLLDMQLPDMPGAEVARQIQRAAIPVKILVLSAHNEPDYIDNLMELGAMGYILKEEGPELIVDAIRGVARGEQGWVSREVAAHMLARLRGDKEEGVRLSPREVDVLRLLTEGKTNQNIAVLLGISEKTVEKYMSAIFQKLGVNETVVQSDAIRQKVA